MMYVTKNTTLCLQEDSSPMSKTERLLLFTYWGPIAPTLEPCHANAQVNNKNKHLAVFKNAMLFLSLCPVYQQSLGTHHLPADQIQCEAPQKHERHQKCL